VAVFAKLESMICHVGAANANAAQADRTNLNIGDVSNGV
jgi:hypothetical protein